MANPTNKTKNKSLKQSKTAPAKVVAPGKKVSAAPKKAAAAPVKAVKAKVAVKTSGKKPAAAPAVKASTVKAAPELKAKQQKKTGPLSPREEKLQKIKLNLIRQKEALLDEAESALNELPGQTIFPDLGDQASAETDRSFMLRLRGREQRLLKKIDEAIERIDGGIFGICDDCGNEIDIKRLEARPVTTMCIECKTLQEEEEKLRE